MLKIFLIRTFTIYLKCNSLTRILDMDQKLFKTLTFNPSFEQDLSVGSKSTFGPTFGPYRDIGPMKSVHPNRKISSMLAKALVIELYKILSVELENTCRYHSRVERGNIESMESLPFHSVRLSGVIANRFCHCRVSTMLSKRSHILSRTARRGSWNAFPHPPFDTRNNQ